MRKWWSRRRRSGSTAGTPDKRPHRRRESAPDLHKFSIDIQKITSSPNLKSPEREALDLINNSVKSEIKSLRQLLASSKIGQIVSTLNRRAAYEALAIWKKHHNRTMPKYTSRSIVSMATFQSKKGYMFIGEKVDSPMNNFKVQDDGRRRSIQSRMSYELVNRGSAYLNAKNPYRERGARSRISKGDRVKTPYGIGKVVGLDPGNRILHLRFKYAMSHGYVHAKYVRPINDPASSIRFYWSYNSKKLASLSNKSEMGEDIPEKTLTGESFSHHGKSLSTDTLNAGAPVSNGTSTATSPISKRGRTESDYGPSFNLGPIDTPIERKIKDMEGDGFNLSEDEEDSPKHQIPRRLIDYITVHRIEHKIDGPQRLFTAERKAYSKDIKRAITFIPDLTPRMASRFPPVNHPDFPFSENVGAAFAFLEGIQLSTFRRKPYVYHSVITQANGDRLYATYLTLDEPDPITIEFQHYQHLACHGTDTFSSRSYVDSESGSARKGAMSPPSTRRHQRLRSAFTTPVATTASSASPSVNSDRRSMTSQQQQPSGGPLNSSPFLLYNPSSQLKSPMSPLIDAYRDTSLEDLEDSEDFLPLKLIKVKVYKPMCICLLSHYPLLTLFEDILKALLDVHKETLRCNENGKSTKVSIERWITHLLSEVPLPVPGRMRVYFKISNKNLSFQLPGIRSPFESTIPLQSVFRLLPLRDIFILLAAILTERRILFHSNSLMRVVHTTQSLLQLIYPFHWWYTYIPTLAESMLDAVEMPGPYILGTRSHNLQLIDEDALDNTMIVDLDTKEIVSSERLPTLPQKGKRTLESNLRKALSQLVVQEDLCPDRISAEDLGKTHDKEAKVMAKSNSDPQNNFDSVNEDGGGGSQKKKNRGFEEGDGGVLMDRFDLEVYRAMLSFFTDLVSGYRRFVYFVNKVPFFNAQGFVDLRSHEKSAAPEDAEFFQHFAFSRAVEVYLEDESEPDEYHELLSLRMDCRHILRGECTAPEIYHTKSPAPTEEFFKRNVDGSGTFLSPQKHCSSVWRKMVHKRQTGLGTRPIEFDQAKWEAYERTSRALRTKSFARLNDSFSMPRGPEDHISPKNPKDAVRIIRGAVISLLSGKNIPRSEMKLIRKALELAEARDILARLLGGGEKPDTKEGFNNSVQCLTENGFKSLCDISKAFLDLCGKQKDYNKGLALMRVSNVFYMQRKGHTKREFLGDVIQKHKFWKNLSFWRASLKAAVVSKMFKSRKSEQYYSFIQAWMVENLHKMVMFNVDIKDIKQFVIGIMQKHNLPFARRRELDAFVERMETMCAALKQLNV